MNSKLAGWELLKYMAERGSVIFRNEYYDDVALELIKEDGEDIVSITVRGDSSYWTEGDTVGSIIESDRITVDRVLSRWPELDTDPEVYVVTLIPIGMLCDGDGLVQRIIEKNI